LLVVGHPHNFCFFGFLLAPQQQRHLFGKSIQNTHRERVDIGFLKSRGEKAALSFTGARRGRGEEESKIQKNSVVLLLESWECARLPFIVLYSELTHFLGVIGASLLL